MATPPILCSHLSPLTINNPINTIAQGHQSGNPPAALCSMRFALRALLRGLSESICQILDKEISLVSIQGLLVGKAISPNSTCESESPFFAYIVESNLMYNFCSLILVVFFSIFFLFFLRPLIVLLHRQAEESECVVSLSYTLS